jgi:hypothetical protein
MPIYSCSVSGWCTSMVPSSLAFRKSEQICSAFRVRKWEPKVELRFCDASMRRGRELSHDFLRLLKMQPPIVSEQPIAVVADRSSIPDRTQMKTLATRAWARSSCRWITQQKVKEYLADDLVSGRLWRQLTAQRPFEAYDQTIRKIFRFLAFSSPLLRSRRAPLQVSNRQLETR